jgi:glutamine amidotransferase
MCKLAAYLGPYIRLDEFLLEPSHNLLQQALRLREIPAVSYPDGFGIGWYTADGVPAVYTNPLPIGSDANLPHLAHSLYARLWLAMVHDATAPFAAGLQNNQPFYDDRLLFLHQGFLEDFSRLRRTIRDFLEPRLEAEIKGNTASEHLFALLRHLLSDDPELPLEQALGALFDLLTSWVGEGRSLLNLIVTDSESLYAARHAMNVNCPPLYYSVDDDAFPEGQLVASEPLTESEFWQPLPEYHLLILNPHRPPELFAW